MSTRKQQHTATKVYRAHAELARLKALDDLPEGGFEGYASVFNVVDEHGDTILPGAFNDALKAFIREGFITTDHNWLDTGVATIEDAFEDERGLYIRARFHSDPDSQAVRTRIVERIQRGKAVGLSVGFIANWDDIEFRDEVMVFKRVAKLIEVALTNIPANPLAMATNAKSLVPPDGDDAGQAAPDVVARNAVEVDLAGITMLFPADTLEQHADAIAEAVHKITGQPVAFAIGEPGGDEPQEQAPEGMPFVEEAEAVLAAAQRFTERAASLAEMRAADGRTLSEDRRQRIAQVAEGLKAGAAALAALAAAPEPAGVDTARIEREARLAKHRLRLMELQAAATA